MTSLERFWRLVDKTPGHGPKGECWLKAVGNSRTGYTQFWADGKNHLAHRWIFQKVKGPIPEGHIVMHTCDVRNCVRPSHLTTGTHKQNTQDAIDKGRLLFHERHPMAKLNFDQVREIRARRAKGETLMSLGAAFNVHHSQIGHIVNGEHWKEAA